MIKRQSTHREIEGKIIQYSNAHVSNKQTKTIVVSKPPITLGQTFGSSPFCTILKGLSAIRRRTNLLFVFFNIFYAASKYDRNRVILRCLSPSYNLWCFENSVLVKRVWTWEHGRHFPQTFRLQNACHDNGKNSHALC